MRWFAALVVAAAGLVVAEPSWAGDDDDVVANLNQVNTEHVTQGVELPGVAPTASDHEVVLEPVCGLTPHVVCDYACEVDGVSGLIYTVWVDGEYSGTHCRVLDDGDDEARITPARVLREFQRLDWSRSELIIQPPDGKTLVNFETNFLTENTEPQRRRITLLGQRIVIEAAPSSYIWQFGDDDRLETDLPGARYPDLQVTHRYLEKAAYRPRVDTVYTGRYRVNGGRWIQIPETLTVVGDAQRLEVIGARPLLVAPDG